MVDFDLARLKDLEAIFAQCPVNGSSQIRHAAYTDEGAAVRRHAGVSEPVFIPATYIKRATAGWKYARHRVLSRAQSQLAN